MTTGTVCRNAQCGMVGVVGLIVVGLVATDASAWKIASIVPVMTLIAIGDSGMTACQWPVIVVCGHGSRGPSGIRGVTGLTCSGYSCRLVTRIIRLVIRADVACRTCSRRSAES